MNLTYGGSIAYIGLLADVEGRQQTGSLHCSLATPYSPSGFAPFLHLYWANGSCGRENGDIMPMQMIAQKADI